MAGECGITLVKKFTYRGDGNEEFSNTYWLSRDTPTDTATWITVITGLWNIEKACYPSTVEFVHAYCYDDSADDAHAVANIDIAADTTITPRVGTLSLSGAEAMPGDAAVYVSWKTAHLNSKGKPVYLRKYFHPACRSTSPASPDAILPAQKTALETLGAFLLESGTPSYWLVRPGHHDDASPLLYRAGPYITTRTLKRRGKRPGS